jgi:hypothetical protein
MCPSQN